jgi:hypothetical protein
LRVAYRHLDLGGDPSEFGYLGLVGDVLGYLERVLDALALLGVLQYELPPRVVLLLFDGSSPPRARAQSRRLPDQQLLVHQWLSLTHAAIPLVDLGDVLDVAVVVAEVVVAAQFLREGGQQA